jgi:hypothetical protein
VRNLAIKQFGHAYYMDNTDPDADATIGQIAAKQAENYRSMARRFAAVAKILG